MSKLVKEAMQVLRDLPEERQEAAARAMLTYVAEADALSLSDDQVAEIEERIGRADRQFISMDEFGKRIHRLGV
jgi:hypothetical protein